jgi:WbqC-like protein family
MRLAIMQPYFLPYIGYFQLIAAVDTFVVYDNIKYTKKGWINRNRFLRNGEDATFSIALQGASDHLDIRDRELAADFDRDRLLNQLFGAYRRAPEFRRTSPLVERIVRCPEPNLFDYLRHSIASVCAHVGVGADIRVSSQIPIDHALTKQDKVIALCKALGATAYVNAIGGTGLYAKEAFAAEGIELQFLKPKPFVYAQFDGGFVPWLSIVDVLMFNAPDQVRDCLAHGYELV